MRGEEQLGDRREERRAAMEVVAAAGRERRGVNVFVSNK